MTPKRIVIVAPAVNTGADRGFYNRQEVGLARALAQLGHSVQVLKAVAKDQPEATERLGDRCEVVDVPSLTYGSHAWIDPRRLQRMRPDWVILTSDLQICVPTLAKWCRRQRVPFVHVVGTVSSSKHERKFVGRFLQVRNLREFSRAKVASKTDALAEQLRSLGVWDVHTIPVGLDTTNLPDPTEELRDEARAERPMPTDARLLGFVGRLEEYKNPLMLAPLLRELRSKGNWQLLIVGDGSLRADLEAAFRREGAESAVHFLPKLENAQMWRLYSAVDVLINLNLNEIFGMALVESMYYGTPVVAIDAPGPRMIIRDGVDGYLRSADVTALAEAVESAYANRSAMRNEAGRRVQDAFTWEAQAQKLVALLEEEEKSVAG